MNRSKPSLSSTNLPRWATYHPYKPSAASSTTASSSNSKSNASSTIQTIKEEHRAQTIHEEVLLRTKAYHHVSSSIVQKAFDETLYFHLRYSVLLPLCDFMNQFQPARRSKISPVNCHSGSNIANIGYCVSGSIGVDNEGCDGGQRSSKDCSSGVIGNHSKTSSTKRRRLNSAIATKKTKTTRERSISLLKKQLKNQMQGVHINIGPSEKKKRITTEAAVIEKTKNITNNKRTLKKYNPTLLPIGIIHVQPSILDRNVIVSDIQRYLTSSIAQEQNPHEINSSSGASDDDCYRPAVCIIKENDSNEFSKDYKNRNYNYNRVEYYLYSILTQCIQQENNPHRFLNLLQLSSSAATSVKYDANVIIDNIISWAQSTNQYNSILIVIENPECIPRHEINRFVCILSSMRRVHGIPICLTLVCISKDLIQKELISNYIDLSSLNGEAGVVFHDFFSVASRVLVDTFIERLFSTNSSNIQKEDTSSMLPIMFSSDMMKTMLDEFDENNLSVVNLMNQLKKALAHHFATKGTFLSLISDKSFMDKYGLHLGWFCVDSNSRKRMLVDVCFHDGLSQNIRERGKEKRGGQISENSTDLLNALRDLYEERIFISFICKLLTLVKEKSHRPQQPIFDVVQAYLLKSDQYKTLLENTFHFIREAPKEDLIELLGSFVDESNVYLSSQYRKLEVRGLCHEKEDGSSYSKKMMELSYFFNRSIVLIDNSTENVQWDLREWLVEELCLMLWRQPFQGDEKVHLSSVVFFGNRTQVLPCTCSANAKPRRDLAAAIADPPVGESNHYDCALDVKLAFTAFDSRVIAFDEWYRRFTDSLPSSDIDQKNETTSNLVQRFIFCLYQLMFCGLISRRNDYIFEKAALVWASAPTDE